MRSQQKTHECYGHGDYGNEERICREIADGDGGFPPAFTDRAAAAKYIEGLEWNFRKVIVELELLGLPSVPELLTSQDHER